MQKIKAFFRRAFLRRRSRRDDPPATLDARKAEAERTRAQRQTRINQAEERASEEPRPSNENESFWRSEYEVLYRAFPLPGERGNEEVVEKLGELFDGEQCDACETEMKRNMFKKAITHNLKTFSFGVVNKFATKEQKKYCVCYHACTFNCTTPLSRI